MLLYDKKIFLLDDENEIIKMIESALRKDGFSKIFSANTIKDAGKIVKKVNPDILILDVMLPDGDGFEFMKKIHKTVDIPVIFLTAKDEDYDKIIGLGLGADDYVTKPFLMKELILRIKAILKRTYSDTFKDCNEIKFKLGSKTIDMAQNLVISNRGTHSFTAKERLILEKLYLNKNKVVTGDALCNYVWNDNLYGYEQTLMTHIGRIRKKIEENPSEPKHLLTVKGIGYKLKIEQGDSFEKNT